MALWLATADRFVLGGSTTPDTCVPYADGPSTSSTGCALAVGLEAECDWLDAMAMVAAAC